MSERISQIQSCRSACVIFPFNYLDNCNGIIPPARRSAEPFTNAKRCLHAKMENGMLFDLRMRGDSRDRLSFTSQTTLPTLLILMTTVSCSRPELPQPRVGIGEFELFSGLVTEAPKEQLIQEDEAHPKIRRETSKTSASRNVATSRKVATARAPKATSPSASGGVSKKANTPARSNAQREQQLFQEFLEWQKRQKDLP